LKKNLTEINQELEEKKVKTRDTDKQVQELSERLHEAIEKYKSQEN
jgi:predicted transcriptional regulator